MGVEEVLQVVVDQVRAVLAPGPVHRAWRDVRLVADLGADSLDVVEIVEGVERALARRGVTVRVPDDELGQVSTLQALAERMVQLAEPRA